MLSFAAVGFHGREWWMLALGVLLVVLSASAQPAAAPNQTDQDRAAELSAKIAGLVTAGDSVQVTSSPADARLGADVVRLLRSRGLRIVDAEGATTVHLTCGDGLRDRVCGAEIRRSGALQVAVSAKARRGGDAVDGPSLALQLTPILAQRGPLLDVAAAGDQWLVLEPHRVWLRPRDETVDASRVPTASIATSRAWPRDLRGRLKVAANAFEAHLPGVTCRGTLTPFAMGCADESEPWPLAIANTGIVPGRNYFTTPEGLPFYGAAPLGSAAESGWIAVDQQGRLTLLDRNRAVASRTTFADDIVRVTASCSSSAYFVAAASAIGAAEPGSTDELQLLRISDTTPVVVQTVRLPGRVTALWGDLASSSATVILRYPGGTRHEAHRVVLSCAR